VHESTVMQGKKLWLVNLDVLVAHASQHRSSASWRQTAAALAPIFGHDPAQFAAATIPPRPVSAGALRDLLEATGLTVPEIAERAGIGDSMVRHYRSGRRRPTAETLGKLRVALGWSEEDVATVATRERGGIPGQPRIK